MTPLYRLLHKKTKWTWGKTETEAFELVKAQLAKFPVLVHYDPTRPLTIATDASPYGVGAVLSHIEDDGT